MKKNYLAHLHSFKNSTDFSLSLCVFCCGGQKLVLVAREKATLALAANKIIPLPSAA